MGTYDNNHDEGHDIYLCIFTDCAKDDRYENKIITTLIMPVQDFSIQCRHCFELGTDGVFMAEPVSNVIGGSICFITMLCTVIPELRAMEKGCSGDGA